MNKALSFITGLLVLFLACAAFVLSYDALHKLALANGITPGLAWLWPLTLDAVMIAASLSVLRNGLAGERAWYAWGLVGAFTALSVTFNVLHAGETWMARGVFALPPLVVFLAFELFVAQARSAIRRAGVVKTLATLEEAIVRSREDLSGLTREGDDLQAAARASADAIVEAAGEHARALVAQAEADGVQMLAEARAQIEALGRQAALAEEKRNMLRAEIETLKADKRAAVDAGLVEQVKELLAARPGLGLAEVVGLVGAPAGEVRRAYKAAAGGNGHGDKVTRQGTGEVTL